MVKSVSYILMEIPMNLPMKRLGANVILPIMAILWGVACACQGIGRTFLPRIAVLSTHYSSQVQCIPTAVSSSAGSSSVLLKV